MPDDQGRLHCLSLGAGVQSSRIAFGAAKGEITPMPDHAIFADTQAEPRPVMDWLNWMIPQLPFPVHIVTRGSLERDVLTLRTSKKGGRYFKTAIPFFTRDKNGKQGRIGHRSCTVDFKIKVITRTLREIVGANRLTAWRLRHRAALSELNAHKKWLKEKKKAEDSGVDLPNRPYPTAAWQECQDDALVVQWIGISMDEIQRAKPSREPWIASRWPLIEMRQTRLACLDWMQRNGYPEPPRSACWFCPFRSNDEWRWLKRNSPEDFEKAVAFDKKSRRLRVEQSDDFRSTPYLHRDLVPLDQVDLRNDVDRGQLLLWNDECSGICGV